MKKIKLEDLGYELQSKGTKQVVYRLPKEKANEYYDVKLTINLVEKSALKSTRTGQYNLVYRGITIEEMKGIIGVLREYE